ncbi:zf-HC2 domain-containing protein [candidate division WOR-3 bacterium]|nr:zf-HC2 domain-containing protein [candidate division WOR-3 bacterium]MCK4528345.1 zf-HC2 domain-containing protein [candidate division WOR-3 bacterium]
MNCERIEELLSPYVDGELLTAEIQEVDDHLEKCEKCRELLVDFQSLSIMVKSIEIPEPSVKIRSRVIGYQARRNYFLRFIFSTSLLMGLGALLFHIVGPTSIPVMSVKDEPKKYYIVKEERAPYIETVYETEGNYILTTYEGGSF